MWRYMCHVYKLAGGTATDMLVHFLGSFYKVPRKIAIFDGSREYRL